METIVTRAMLIAVLLLLLVGAVGCGNSKY
jgi:hypothetical protein